MTVQELASELSKEFEYKEQDSDGGHYHPINYNKSAGLQKVSDSVYKAVSDFPWDEIHTQLLRISDYEDEYLDDGTCSDEVEQDPYYRQLDVWFIESNHSEEVNEVLQEGFESKDIYEIIGYAQQRWKRAICEAVIEAVREVVTEEAEEEAT